MVGEVFVVSADLLGRLAHALDQAACAISDPNTLGRASDKEVDGECDELAGELRATLRYHGAEVVGL